MDQEHWQRVQKLFESAVEKPPEEISAWLDEVCGDDPTLKGEVEDLLRSDAEAGSFIETAIRGGVRLPRTSTGVVSPSKLGKYEIEAKIGQGGFGVVFRGRDPMLRRHVALKTCSTEDRHLRRRFFREGRIAAGLQHANVTTVHDLGVENGIPYLVQEFLGGEDLDHLIGRRQSLSLLRKLEVLVQIARGLEYAHQVGVLHRDIKPANIRLLESGEVKIMDFGIAKLLSDDTRLTGTGMAMGTVGYLAPEQLRGEEVDTRADVFAFGVLAYELLSFERPFKGETFSQVSYQLLYVEPKPLIEVWPDCPVALNTVIDRCLQKQQAQRYMTFTEVLEDLEPQLDMLRTGSAANALPATLVMPRAAVPTGSQELPATELDHLVPGRRGWHAARLAGIALALVLGVLAMIYWPREPSPSPGEQVADAPTLAVVAGEPDPPTPTEAGLPASDGVSGQQDEAAGPASAAPRTAGSEDSSPASTSSSSAPNRNVEIEQPEPQPPAPSTAQAPSPSLGDKPAETPAADTQGESPSSDTKLPTPIETAEGAGSPADAPAGATEPPASAQVAAVEPTAVEPEQPELVEQLPAAGASAAGEPASEAPAVASTMKRGDLVTPGPGVTQPRLLERPQPKYPERARRRGKEDRVVVRVLVDENGRVLQAVTAPDKMGFAASAKAAAVQASFEPATRDGIAGKMWTEMVFEFSLQ